MAGGAAFRPGAFSRREGGKKGPGDLPSEKIEGRRMRRGWAAVLLMF